VLTAHSPEYRLLFADRVQRHFFNGGALAPASTAATYQVRVDEVKKAIVTETARWGDNRVVSDYTQASWLVTQNGLFANYFPNRTTTVLNQLKNRGLFPSAVNAPTFSQHGGTFATSPTITITNPNGAGTIYYTLDGTDPRLDNGNVSPNAVAYAGGIPITETHRVFARVVNGTNRSTAEDRTFTVDVNALRIGEVMYNPAPPAPGGKPKLQIVK
jgi:hypothetical protein